MNIIYVLIYLSKSIEFQNCTSCRTSRRMTNKEIDSYVISCQPSSSFYIDVSKINYHSYIYFLEKTKYPHEITHPYLGEIYENKNKMPTLYIFDQAYVHFKNIRYYNGQINIIGSPKLKSEYNITFKEVNIYNSSLEFPFYYDNITYSYDDLIKSFLRAIV